MRPLHAILVAVLRLSAVDHAEIPLVRCDPPAVSSAERKQAVPPQAAVTSPPQSLKLDPFYQKYTDAGGIPVVASKDVPDDALLAAASIVQHMLATAPEMRAAMARGHTRVAVMGRREKTTDLPEHHLLTPKGYWDKRARGLGGTPFSPTTSCAEENVLALTDDPYRGESILIHEFAHAIHLIGMKAVDAGFDARLKAAYGRAKDRGLWKNTYAATDHKEYWAEGVQSWFDANRFADPPDGTHNAVHTRSRLEEYDPDLAALIRETFGDNPWRWTAEPYAPTAPSISPAWDSPRSGPGPLTFCVSRERTVVFRRLRVLLTR